MDLDVLGDKEPLDGGQHPRLAAGVEIELEEILALAEDPHALDLALDRADERALPLVDGEVLYLVGGHAVDPGLPILAGEAKEAPRRAIEEGDAGFYGPV